MKFFISLILIAILSFAVCLYLPWWSVAIVGFVVAAALNLSWGKAFLSGFIAIFILWGAISFILSSNNENILAHKVSVLILTMDSPYLLILVTALIGALVAGLGALTGSFVRPDVRKY